MRAIASDGPGSRPALAISMLISPITHPCQSLVSPGSTGLIPLISLSVPPTSKLEPLLDCRRYSLRRGRVYDEQDDEQTLHRRFVIRLSA